MTGVPRRHSVPLAATLAGVVAAMAWSMLYVVHANHLTYWRVPGDIWSTLRAAHFIGWGDLGGIYGAGTGLVSFPGAALLLVPVALIASFFGLSQSFPYYLPHPTAWLVLGPYMMLVASVALFGADALARRVGMSPARRAVVCVVGAVVLFPVDAVWGHPEDAVAVGLLLYSLCFVVDDRVVGAGWLAGAAVAVQPLVLLGIPVLAAWIGWRRLPGFLVRAGLPSLAVLATPLLAEPRATLHALMDQPNFPRIDHATPWTSLAPHLGGHGAGLAVAAGPGRLVALGAAVVLVPWVAHRRGQVAAVVWALAVALALRCLTESVMDAFYLWPPLAVALVAAGARSWKRLVVAGVAGVAASAVAEVHLVWWAWWAAVTAGLLVAVCSGFPRASGTRRSSSAAGMPLAQQGANDRSVQGESVPPGSGPWASVEPAGGQPVLVDTAT